MQTINHIHKPVGDNAHFYTHTYTLTHSYKLVIHLTADSAAPAAAPAAAPKAPEPAAGQRYRRLYLPQLTHAILWEVLTKAVKQDYNYELEEDVRCGG